MYYYETLLIVLIVCYFSIAFSITIEELKIYKLFEVKKINILFSKNQRVDGKKTIVDIYNEYDDYHVPLVEVDPD